MNTLQSAQYQWALRQTENKVARILAEYIQENIGKINRHDALLACLRYVKAAMFDMQPNMKIRMALDLLAEAGVTLEAPDG